MPVIYRDQTLLFKPQFKHPWVTDHYSRTKLICKPEIVVRVFSDIPRLQKEYPQIWKYYSNWNRRLQRSQYIKEHTSLNLDFKFVMPPMTHQMKALVFSLNIPASALFLEQGTGKTYTALLNAAIRKHSGLAKKVLVIAPPPVLSLGWRADCLKFTHLDPVILHTNARPEPFSCPLCGKNTFSNAHAKEHFRVFGLKRKNTTVEDYVERFQITKLYNRNKVYKLSFEEMLGLDGKSRLFITSPAMVRLKQDLFMKAGFDMVILDESTMLRDPSSKTTKSIIKLGDKAKYRMILTGTPFANGLDTIWAQMRFLDSGLGDTYDGFVSRYFKVHPKIHYLKWPLSGSKERVVDLIKDRSIRFLKKDCLDLPERSFHFREVTMSGAAKKAYKTMFDEQYALLEDKTEITVKMALHMSSKLQQITNGFIIDEEGETNIIDVIPPKIKEVLEIVKGSTKKVIIWCIFKHDTKMLMKHLKEYNPVLLRSANIEKTAEQFKKDPKCKVAVSHPKSCKFGLTLNEADTTIYYSMSYSDEDYLQSLDRNHRNGQEDKVNVYHIFGSPVDREIYEKVGKKIEFGESMSNDPRIWIERMRA